MEKQKVKLASTEWTSKEFSKQGEFKIKPWLSLEDKLKLVEAYLNAIFDNDDDKYTHAMKELEAEYSIIIGVVDLCTDLSIDFEKDSAGFEVIISSGLWDLIRSNIHNYNEFREELKSIVSHAREDVALEKSIGTNFDRLAEAAMKLIEQFSNADISDEGMKRAAETFKSSLETLQVESAVSNITNVTNVSSSPEKKVRKRTSKKEIAQ
jgi:hypothetical protein